MSTFDLSKETVRALQKLDSADVEGVIQELAALQQRGGMGAILTIQKAGSGAFHIRRYDETDSYRSTTQD